MFDLRRLALLKQGCANSVVGLIRLSIPVFIPRWGEATEILKKAPDSFKMAPVDMPHAAMWRRWIVGREGTQAQRGQPVAPTPLWKLPPRRQKAKASPPPWQQQCEVAKSFLAKAAHVLSQIQIEGIQAHAWLEREGGIDIHAIKGLAAQRANLSLRATALLSQNADASKRKHHICDIWKSQERPKCALCAHVGYASRQLQSMRGP